jgi:GDP-L-fucose synthase
MEKDARILVTGHEAMIGGAILRRLGDTGFTGLITNTSSELRLTDQPEVARFFKNERPDYVFLSAPRTGGILANSRYPAEFFYENLQSQANVIHAAWQTGVKKLLFLASSCVYPKDSAQPMKEEYLLTGRVEPTNEYYAIAKIAGIEMCRSYNIQYGASFIPVVPSDLYGPLDDFDPETSHFLPALVRKMHEAKVSRAPEVVVWGSGAPRRDSLYIDDLADACIFLMQHYRDSGLINIGSGRDCSIKETALIIKDVIGYRGELVFDKSKPDGAPRKLLDTSRINRLGWSPSVGLEEGIRRTYEWYKNPVITG